MTELQNPWASGPWRWGGAIQASCRHSSGNSPMWDQSLRKLLWPRGRTWDSEPRVWENCDEIMKIMIHSCG